MANAGSRNRRFGPPYPTQFARACNSCVGTTDGHADIHGANERVLQDQSEKATPAEADFFGRLAAGDAR